VLVVLARRLATVLALQAVSTAQLMHLLSLMAVALVQ
jgi:hypothetical protein